MPCRAWPAVAPLQWARPPSSTVVMQPSFEAVRPSSVVTSPSIVLASSMASQPSFMVASIAKACHIIVGSIAN